VINLKRRLLAKVPIKKANNADINLAIEVENDGLIAYLVSAEIIKVEEKETLLLYFYFKANLRAGNTKAAFRVFLSTDDYITQDLSETTTKWRTGSISSLVCGYHYCRWEERCILTEPKSAVAIKRFLGTDKTDENPLKEIDNFQQEVMAKRLDKKHQAIKDRIDAEMEKVPELPEDFIEWLEYEAMYHSRYIYYKYKARKKLDGYCTNCKADVVVEGARHNKKGICPNCNSPIVFKATGKSTRVEDAGQSALIQKIDDGIIVRYFGVDKKYHEHYRNPKLSYHELSRDFYYNNGEIKNYEYFDFKQTNEKRWCDGQGRFGFPYAVLYDRNLDEALEGTIWQYSAIKEFATHQKGFGFPTYSYLLNYRKYPSIEYLVKLKLYKFVHEVITGSRMSYHYHDADNVDLNGRNLQEVLKIDKSQLTTAQRINAGAKELYIIRKTREANLNVTDEQILFISEHLDIDRLLAMTEYTTIYKIIKYIKEQTTEHRNKGDTFRDWVDYIENCKKLRYNLKNEFVLFPRDLTAAHDRAYVLVEKSKNKEFEKAIAKVGKKLETLSWEYKGHIVVVPKTLEEIIKEGHKLHHCVGTYVERVAKEQTIILFLRKKEKPDEPYYTIQVNPRNYEIIQCRGKNNKSMEGNIKNIINKYEKEKLAPLNYKKAI